MTRKMVFAIGATVIATLLVSAGIVTVRPVQAYPADVQMRQIQALERIATALEKHNRSCH